jgi:hypothetical protein
VKSCAPACALNADYLAPLPSNLASICSNKEVSCIPPKIINYNSNRNHPVKEFKNACLGFHSWDEKWFSNQNIYF